jgi:hypothetical protein
MALTLPPNVYEQPLRSIAAAAGEPDEYEQSWKGDDVDVLECFARITFPAGSVYKPYATDTPLVVKTWRLERGAGGTGTLTVSFSAIWLDGQSATPGNSPLKDVWSVQAVRLDKSIECYCADDSVGSAWASLPQLRAWIAEPDGALADSFQFKTADGEVRELSPYTIDVAKKYAKGVRSVMRFYPQIRRRREYAVMPDEIYSNLGFPGTPSGFNEGTAQKPSALKTLVDAFDWLKTDDGVQQTADNRWERSEAWIGLEKGGIDADLYGQNRWDMPYTGPQQQGGGN